MIINTQGVMMMMTAGCLPLEMTNVTLLYAYNRRRLCDVNIVLISIV